MQKKKKKNSGVGLEKTIFTACFSSSKWFLCPHAPPRPLGFKTEVFTGKRFYNYARLVRAIVDCKTANLRDLRTCLQLKIFVYSMRKTKIRLMANRYDECSARLDVADHSRLFLLSADGTPTLIGTCSSRNIYSIYSRDDFQYIILVIFSHNYLRSFGGIPIIDNPCRNFVTTEFRDRNTLLCIFFGMKTRFGRFSASIDYFIPKDSPSHCTCPLKKWKVER